MFKFESKLDWRRFLMDSIAKGVTWNSGAPIHLESDTELFNPLDPDVCAYCKFMMVRNDEPFIIANPYKNNPDNFELFKAPVIEAIEIDADEFEHTEFPKARVWTYHTPISSNEEVIGHGISIELDNTKLFTVADLDPELMVKLAKDYCYQFGYDLKVGGLLTKES